MRPNPKLITAFDDLISEKELRSKLGVSAKSLQRLRSKGVLTCTSITGRNYMYSKTEIAKAYNLQP